MAAEHWHLDKRVPIALIVTIFLQSAAAVWWASGMHEKMGQVERRLHGFNERNLATDRQVQEQSRQIAVLSTQVAATNEMLADLRVELRGTNQLLREMLQANAINGAINGNGGNGRSGPNGGIKE